MTKPDTIRRWERHAWQVLNTQGEAVLRGHLHNAVVAEDRALARVYERVLKEWAVVGALDARDFDE